MILHPLSLDGMIGYIGWIGITVLLLVNIYYKVLPTFYEKAMEVSSIQQYSKRVRSFTLDNFSKLVRKYHIQLIKEGSIIVQGIIAPSILPYLMLLPMIFWNNERRNSTQITVKLYSWILQVVSNF